MANLLWLMEGNLDLLQDVGFYNKIYKLYCWMNFDDLTKVRINRALRTSYNEHEQFLIFVKFSD